MTRCRLCSPGPHAALQSVHLVQAAKTQLTGGSAESHFCVLQGSITCSAATPPSGGQCLPLPRPCALMLRERRYIPSHEQEQSLQSVQVLKAQSTSAVQETFSLHHSYSCERPIAGLPQSEGSTLIMRWRTDTPPSQLEVQVPHSAQSVHSPSVHEESHDCVWHA